MVKREVGILGSRNVEKSLFGFSRRRCEIGLKICARYIRNVIPSTESEQRVNGLITNSMLKLYRKLFFVLVGL